jgi:hypothetical protein
MAQHSWENTGSSALPLREDEETGLSHYPLVFGLWPLVFGLSPFVFRLSSLVFGLWSLVFGLVFYLSCASVEIFVFFSFFPAGELIFENAEYSLANQSNYSGGHESVKRVSKFNCFLKVIQTDGYD